MQKSLKFQTVSFFIILAITVVLVARVFLPYASVLLWSAILYIMFAPLYHKLLKKLNSESHGLKCSRELSLLYFRSALSYWLPESCFFFAIKLIGQGQMFVKKMMNFFVTHPQLLRMEKDAPLNELVMQISMGTIDLSVFDVKKELMNLFLQYANTIVRYATSIAKNIGNFVLSLLFMCFALYFLFIDGQYLASVFVTAIPIQVSEGQKLAAKVKDTITNLFMGTFSYRYVSLQRRLLCTLFFRWKERCSCPF